MPLPWLLVWLLPVLVANGLLTAVYVLSRRAPKATRFPDRISAALAVVRPLRGAGSFAARNNRAVLSQEYAGLTEIVFVSSSTVDEGLALARGLAQLDPRVRCLSSGWAAGTSTDKARNMIAGWRATDSPFVAFCDADVMLPAGILEACMQAFGDASVGAVFAPVAHCPHGRLAALLAQLSSGDKLAAIRAFDRLGVLGVLEGGLMILRRSAVEHVGGIELIADTVADDLRLAAELRAKGFQIHAGPTLTHELAHASLGDAMAQYHRWMVCQRSEGPWLLLPQLLFHPIVLPLLGICLFPWSPAAWTILIASVAWRMALTAVIERSLLRPIGLRFGWWVFARPLADLAHFAFGVSSYVVPFVTWGGVRYQLGPRGRIIDASPAPEHLPGVGLRSVMVGAVATAADLVALTLLTGAMNVAPAVANVATLGLGLAVQFVGNKYFAFRDHSATVGRQGARFLGVEAITLLLNLISFHILAVTLGFPVVFARVLGTFAVYVTFSLPAWRRVVFAPEAAPRDLPRTTTLKRA